MLRAACLIIFIAVLSIVNVGWSWETVSEGGDGPLVETWKLGVEYGHLVLRSIDQNFSYHVDLSFHRPMLGELAPRFGAFCGQMAVLLPLWLPSLLAATFLIIPAAAKHARRKSHEPRPA